MHIVCNAVCRELETQKHGQLDAQGVASWVLASQTATHYTFAMHVAASPLNELVIKRTFQSLGHVMRAHACHKQGTQPWYLAVSLMVGSAGEAGPRARTHTHTFMLKKVDVDDPRKWLDVLRLDWMGCASAHRTA